MDTRTLCYTKNLTFSYKSSVVLLLPLLPESEFLSNGPSYVVLSWVIQTKIWDDGMLPNPLFFRRPEKKY